MRTRAAEFLGLTGQKDPVAVIKEVLKQAKTQTEANLILNTVTLLQEKQPDLSFGLSREMFPAQWTAKPNDLVNRRLEYLLKE